MAPLFLMLSERVLMNCLVDLMPYASQTRVSRPQKNWAMVEPSSTAGVSEKIDRIPSTTPGAEPPRDARDSGSARSHSTHLETSSSNRP